MLTPDEVEVIRVGITLAPYIFGITGLIYGVLFLFNSFVLEEKGVECWSQIIPVYNIYIWFKTFWKPKVFYIMLGSFAFMYFSSFAISVILINNNVDNNNFIQIVSIIYPILFIIWLIAYLVIGIILNHKISVSFGHGVPFTIGLIFFNPIFMIVLGIQSIKNGVIDKISKGRKIFLILWTVFIILLFVGIGFIYSAIFKALIKNY